jgi:HEAT repeat protein
MEHTQSQRDRGRSGRGLRRVLGLVPFAFGPLLGGCAGFWDEVTSRDFKITEVFSKPAPLTVLQTSKDGDKRARAYAALREPAQHGGTREDQEMVLRLLTTASAEEHHVRCRLAAIEALGQFKDTRAVDALKNAYAEANNRAGNFAPEQASMVRCQVLTALGQTTNPAAVDFLVQVIRQPPSDFKSAEKDRQQLLDERIAAARALGHFRQPQATEALLTVLRQEKDIALRDGAHESLQAATGKHLPRDAKAWEDYLHQPADGKSDVQQAQHKVLGVF